MVNINYFHHPHFMVVLSAACMAECKYCFGPHKGKVTDIQTVDKTIAFINYVVKKTNLEKVRITFHGGEPLIAPIAIWEHFLKNITSQLEDKVLKLSIQSNLWNLNEDFCRLFRKYNVSIGTSLDGPKEINDRQRGKGYFDKTYKGIKLAEKYGLEAGCISTFTPESINRWKEVMDFFMKERISFSIHPSLKPLYYEGNGNLFINTEQYETLLIEMMDAYIQNRKHIQIDSFDQICSSVAFNTGKVCTFGDCAGMFLAIDPEGDIYSCQRFCGKKEFAIGNVFEMPSLSDIENHENARKIINREKEVRVLCGDCEHLNYCKGGCYYNALSGGDGIIDHFCKAYKNIFGFVKEKLLSEISSEQNIKAMQLSPVNGDPLFLKKGKIISLTKNIHPSVIGQNAKMAIALHEIAKGPDLYASANRMCENKITSDKKQTYMALQQIKNTMLASHGNHSLNNLYIHITFQCNLSCTHCYASAGISEDMSFMKAEELKILVSKAEKSKFTKTIITGGEPLVHPQINEILLYLKTAKEMGMNLALRTNLTGNYSDDFLLLIAEAFNQVIVSVDGNKTSHDERRGAGSYKLMKSNITRYQNLVKSNAYKYAELSLACVMNSKNINGEPGNSVKELAESLGIKRVRFRPLLPLGRAKNWNERPVSEAINSHLDPMTLIEQGIRPNISCGLGQNLYIEPSGDSFPCYAYHKPLSMLGNVLEKGLEQVLNSPEFMKLSIYDVDNIEKCKDCEYRYLCGGACRAWSGEHTQYRLNAPPIECDGLKVRAKEIVDTARRFLLDDDM